MVITSDLKSEPQPSCLFLPPRDMRDEVLEHGEYALVRSVRE